MIFLKRPEYLLFIDKVGNNTNMKDDKRCGGERKIGIAGEKTKTEVSTNDSHFPTLGFTAATGEPVMCAQIFSGSTINSHIQCGIDIRTAKGPNGDTMEDNFGLGQRYPGGPTCIFRRKLVPCFVCVSEKGGITSELLKQMLQRMDQLNLFP